MTAHTHESPREVLLSMARDSAEYCRRHGNEERAREWDALTAELGAVPHAGCGGQWVSMRVVCDADDPQVCARCGAHRLVPADGLTALIEDPDVAALHEPQGPPVDGRDVDRAPDIVDGTGTECPRSERADGTHSWRFDGDDPYVICHFCGEMRDALTGRVVRGPQTGGGAGVVPPDPAPSSPHLWLLADDDPRSRDCTCLIGDDHVAEPRFEKEN